MAPGLASQTSAGLRALSRIRTAGATGSERRGERLMLSKGRALLFIVRTRGKRIFERSHSAQRRLEQPVRRAFESRQNFFSQVRPGAD